MAVGVRMVITAAAVEGVVLVLLVLTHQLVLDKSAPPVAETQPSKVRHKGIL